MDHRYPCSVVPLLGGCSKVAVINLLPSPKERNLQRELRTTTVCLFLSVLPPDEFSPGATYQSSHVNTKEFAGPFRKNSETSPHAQSCALLQTCCDIDIPSTAHLGMPTEPSCEPHALGCLLGKAKYSRGWLEHWARSPGLFAWAVSLQATRCWALASRVLYKGPTYLPYHISLEITV